MPYTRHFATADDPESALFGEQRVRFAQAAERSRGALREPNTAMRGNSAALLRDSRVWYDRVRPGLLLYALCRRRWRRRCRCVRDDAAQQA